MRLSTPICNTEDLLSSLKITLCGYKISAKKSFDDYSAIHSSQSNKDIEEGIQEHLKKNFKDNENDGCCYCN
ncbi:hypothetical protein PVAND_014490 [Polypedilum vanderplanki]|uniref:Uncharacterized protein n=1 Tax=Polypedilum vanderplanki TaxID=319348 RepID=A0A9J6B9X4_POLVA|nr:hypothetical protein PVAND_014490 [Polypedilum vanderplanki]